MIKLFIYRGLYFFAMRNKMLITNTVKRFFVLKNNSDCQSFCDTPKKDFVCLKFPICEAI